MTTPPESEKPEKWCSCERPSPMFVARCRHCGLPINKESEKPGEWEDRFRETKFAKEGGSCFECCDYEDMYGELLSFIRRVAAESERRGREAKANEIWKEAFNSPELRDGHIEINALLDILKISPVRFSERHPANRGDVPCADCGTQDNACWYTDNVFWNEIMGAGRSKILCINCFTIRAEEMFDVKWRLLPDWQWQLARRTSPSSD